MFFHTANPKFKMNMAFTKDSKNCPSESLIPILFGFVFTEIYHEIHFKI